MSTSESNRRRPKRRRDEEPDSSRRDAEDTNGAPDTEESGEDLLGSDMAEDYREAEALNNYDEEDLDEREYGDMDVDTRRRAEQVMTNRDRREKVRRGLDIAGESDEGDEAADSEGAFQGRGRKLAAASGADEDEAANEPFDIGGFPATPSTLSEERVKSEVKRRFYRFLKEYVSTSGDNVHHKLIEEMVAVGGASLPISYIHLSTAHPTFGVWLADMPRLMLQLFDEVATEVVQEQVPEYGSVQTEIHVRITSLPIEDKLRDLRSVHLNTLVKVAGVVTKRTAVFPSMKLVVWTCNKCGTPTPPIANNSITTEAGRPGRCLECQAEGPFTPNDERTIYQNYQKLSLQESPGSVPAGRVPRYKEVILLADLIDACRPGEEVEITGIYTNQFNASINAKNGFPVFCTLIEANYVQRRTDALTNTMVSEDDIKEIEELARDPHIVQRIGHSVAPSIYGHGHVKMAIAMAMFGGREKNVNNKHRIRGDINVLLLGDPGTAKSQMLKYVEKTAPRCVYTTGKGASAVGLTAAVTKDPITGEWTLEGGALVLADRGVCCIDEFDKMTDQDRTSIHEAMEQQSISISKAGIVTTLQARCAVVAAANPIGGRYDVTKPLSENVQLTDPILTRFDVLCVLRDEVDPVGDERLAAFVMRSHVRSHPAAAEERARREERMAAAAAAAVAEGRNAEEAAEMAKAEGLATSESEEGTFGVAGEDASSSSGHADVKLKPIPQDILKKYILYAREKVKPSLESIDKEKIPKLYSELRREAEISSGVPIAVRHIESILRMSEAVARMRHAAYVSDSDLNLAIRTQLHSFIAAQKIGVQKALREQFSRYMSAERSYNTLLMVKLRELAKEWQVHQKVMHEADFDGPAGNRVEIKVSDLLDRARRLGITDVSEFLSSKELRAADFQYVPGKVALIVKDLGEM